MSRTWDEAFDGVPRDPEELQPLRSACARAAERALLPLDEIEELSERFLDPGEPWTREELVDALNRLKMHERRPCDDYAPSQRALARWIKSFVFLSD
jgi:hypothetical protein